MATTNQRATVSDSAAWARQTRNKMTNERQLKVTKKRHEGCLASSSAQAKAWTWLANMSRLTPTVLVRRRSQIWPTDGSTNDSGKTYTPESPDFSNAKVETARVVDLSGPRFTAAEATQLSSSGTEAQNARANIRNRS
ncbi:hypothetical protein E4U34_000824 [Claviceps purpurea]|nr:hypothetical protein E4U34_000824 [Claviceps purpurea]